MEMKHLVLFVPDYMARRMKENSLRLEKLCNYNVVKGIFAPADLAGLLYINAHLDVFVGNLAVADKLASQFLPMDPVRAILNRWLASTTSTALHAEIENIELLAKSQAIEEDVSVRLYCENRADDVVPSNEAFELSDHEPHITYVTIAERAFCKNALFNHDKQKVLVKEIVAKLYRYMTEAEVASTYFFRRYLEQLQVTAVR